MEEKPPQEFLVKSSAPQSRIRVYQRSEREESRTFENIKNEQRERKNESERTFRAREKVVDKRYLEIRKEKQKEKRILTDQVELWEKPLECWRIRKE